MQFKNRRGLGLKGGLGVIAVLALVVVVALYAWNTQAVQDQDPGAIIECQSDTSVTHQYSVVDVENVGTAVHSIDVLQKLDGRPATTLAVLTDQTLSPNDQFETLVGDNSTTYYTDVVSGVVPCKPTDTTTMKLRLRSALSYTIRNSDGITNNTGATSTANQTIGLGGSEVMTLSLQASTKDGALTSPGCNYIIVACDAPTNSSVWDWNEFTLDGSAPIGMPTLNGSFSDYDSAFKISRNIIDTDGYVDFQFRIVAKDTADPGETDDIICQVFDAEYYENTNTGLFECGVATNAGIDVGVDQGTARNVTIGIQ